MLPIRIKPCMLLFHLVERLIQRPTTFLPTMSQYAIAMQNQIKQAETFRMLRADSAPTSMPYELHILHYRAEVYNNE